MERKLKEKISGISIVPKASLLEALRLMDELERKLLLVIDGAAYRGVISVGDVQRALIGGKGLECLIEDVLRPNARVVKECAEKSAIKSQMLELRTEFMPIVNDVGGLVDVIFWDEVISSEVLGFKQFDAPVVVMAGGKGTRLKPFSNILPKPLFPIGEHTILEEIIGRFQRHGCKEFWLSVNYKADFIRNYVDQIEPKLLGVHYFQEDQPLGTAGSLHLIRDQIKETFFVSNCDIIIDADYGEILQYHSDEKNEITLVAALKEVSIPYGTVEAGEGGQLLNFKEKPNLNFMINTGLYVLEPSLLNEIPENEFFHITQLIDQVRERGGKVGVFPVSEKSWCDIGEWQEYNRTIGILGSAQSETL